MVMQFSRVNGNLQNRDRSRWYGIRPGDLVEERAFGRVSRGVVQYLHSMDNNGCTIRVNGRDRKAVCEWLVILEKVDD